MAAAEKNALNTRDFSKVIITLENVLITGDKLSPTPSMLDGLDSDTDAYLRILGCEMIQTSGVLLKLPQVAMATGQVLFQRFYYSKSFVKHNMEVVAMACVNLASKIEECPRRIRDVINVFHHIKQVRNQKTIHPLVLDQNYINLKNQVIKGERRILKELGFCVHVKHPHKVIVMYLQVLECEKNEKLVQCAWNYMNDSFRTHVFVSYNPETIASACIYMAARQLQIALPNNPPWFSIFNVDEEDIHDICLSILRLYARPRPNYDELEKKVNEARKIQIEAKQKAKGVNSGNVTPISTSRQNSPKNVSPNPSLLGLKKIKTEDGNHSDAPSFGDRCINHIGKKKRSRSPSDFSHSRSRSRSRSSSRSMSPSSKRGKLHGPLRGRKIKKSRYNVSPNRYMSKERRSHKRKKHAYSRSRSRSFSHSPDRFHAAPHKKYYKEEKKERYFSPDRHHSRKHRNGHRSPSRDHYDKYSRR